MVFCSLFLPLLEVDWFWRLLSDSFLGLCESFGTNLHDWNPEFLVYGEKDCFRLKNTAPLQDSGVPNLDSKSALPLKVASLL